MPLRLLCPRDLTIEVHTLSQHAFSGFGTVIENPNPTLEPSIMADQLPPKAMLANQGTALKYVDVTKLLDLYISAPSRVASRVTMNMFVCAPRVLRRSQRTGIQCVFQLDILERHPFTTQTFIPLGLDQGGEDVCYLVIVAPSLPPSSEDEYLPVPAQDTLAGSLPGRGLPDLTKLQAFMAKGSQAVTYGAGTWHAPMVVIGRRSVDFVVMQYANGIEIEDCQEVLIQSQDQDGIEVAVGSVGKKHVHGSPKL